MVNKLKKVDYRNYGVIIGFIFLCLVVTIAKPEFMSSRNVLNLMRQTSVIGIMAAGMTLVIISGNFDISVGYICCFAGVITAKLLNAGMNLFLVILIVLAAGAVIGSLSGFAISVVNIPSMIATLGMGQVVYGALLLISGGYPTSINHPVMSFIGKEAILGIPVPIYFFVLSILLVSFVLSKTQLGRHIYAVGGNKESSRLCGINTRKVTILLFMISSMLAAFSGVVLTARVGTATASAATGYELDAIASVVIGGTAVSGGEGSAWKTIIGVLFMGVIANSFNLLRVDTYFQYMLKGLIILVAVGFDCLNRKRAEAN